LPEPTRDIHMRTSALPQYSPGSPAWVFHYHKKRLAFRSRSLDRLPRSNILEARLSVEAKGGILLNPQPLGTERSLGWPRCAELCSQTMV